MRLVRVAIANINTTVGACRSNTEKAIAAAEKANAGGARLVVFPEQTIGGYPPEDLVQWRGFIDAQWAALNSFAEGTRELHVASAIGLVVQRGAHLYNVAALVHRGKIHGLVPKEKLPLYGVFYEARTFAPGSALLSDDVAGVPFGDLTFALDFGTIALEVCEDAWSPDGPMRRRSFAGAELIANLSASPYRLGVAATRREMISTRSADCQVTIVYANLVGANDGLIFDGGGLVAQNGRTQAEPTRFTEQVSFATVDLDRTRRLRTENTTWRADQIAFEQAQAKARCIVVPGATGDGSFLTYPSPPHGSFFLPATGERPSPRAEFCEELLDALSLGIGDYFEKTAAFKTIGVALSGGRDSLLALILARRWISRRFGALGAEQERAKANEVLRAFFMPTRYSSTETHDAAAVAAKELDVPFALVSIDEAFEKELAAIESMLRPGETISSLARQNVQARVRAERMWTWANCSGGLFLQTSNMSEKAVGYATIGGDSEGALSVIANVPKTVVNYLLDYLLETKKWEGIRLTLLKPASAELAPDQEDERELMPFPVLDACFYLYAGEKLGASELTFALVSMFPHEEPTHLEAWAKKFVRLFVASIYKWTQAPISLHVGNLDLERERALQLPVVQRTEW